MLLHAGWADSTGLKCVPGKAAATAPHIFWFGLPTAQRTTDLWTRDSGIRFVLIFVTGFGTGEDVGVGLHHGGPFGDDWFSHTPYIVYDIDGGKCSLEAWKKWKFTPPLAKQASTD